MNRKGIDQLAFNEAQTDLKNGQISAIIAVDQGSAAFVDGASASRDRPNIEQGYRQGQTGQAVGVMQHGGFQIKPVPFQVTKHFFNPHSASISLKGELAIRQIGDQTPGFLLAHSPMDQQVGRVDFALGQPSLAQPAALPGLLYPTTKVMPSSFRRQTDMHRSFLTQDIIPAPQIY